jgi:hypothetical protein
MYEPQYLRHVIEAARAENLDSATPWLTSAGKPGFLQRNSPRPSRIV